MYVLWFRVCGFHRKSDELMNGGKGRKKMMTGKMGWKKI